MNYATALALPSWTAEVQSYSQTVIRYTPIIIKAFSKTIAPQLLITFKDLSHYYVQCGKDAGKWAMTAAGITHNPLQAAVRSAHAELTSAEAIVTYRHIRHIIREAAMDALVIGLCGVVAVATTIETAQANYRHAVAFYDRIQARFNPAPVIVPTVEVAFAATSDEADSWCGAFATIVEEVRYERYFLEQFDQLDSDILAINAEEIDEAIAQVTVAQLKSARAALALSVESDRLAREALAYVIDQAVRFTMVEQQPVAKVAVVEELAASLEVPGATGAPKRQRKTGTGKVAEAKPKQARARVGAKTGA